MVLYQTSELPPITPFRHCQHTLVEAMPDINVILHFWSRVVEMILNTKPLTYSEILSKKGNMFKLAHLRITELLNTTAVWQLETRVGSTFTSSQQVQLIIWTTCLEWKIKPSTAKHLKNAHFCPAASKAVAGFPVTNIGECIGKQTNKRI